MYFIQQHFVYKGISIEITISNWFLDKPLFLTVTTISLHPHRHVRRKINAGEVGHLSTARGQMDLTRSKKNLKNLLCLPHQRANLPLLKVTNKNIIFLRTTRQVLLQYFPPDKCTTQPDFCGKLVSKHSKLITRFILMVGQIPLALAVYIALSFNKCKL